MNSRSMAAQPTGRFRRFAQTPVGKVTLVVISTLLVLGTFAYVSPLLAVPVFLFTGLAIPIMSGVKRPRFLAVSGLVVLLAVAPVANVVYTQMLLTPVPAAASDPLSPYGAGGSVLQNASVAPFSGDSGTNFTWTVTFDPTHLAAELNKTNWSNDTLQLYISTCPGATAKNASYCGSGYPFTILNYSFAARPVGPTEITFHHIVGTDGVWSWQMGLLVQNNTTHNFSRILLVGDPTWNGIEGPVVGGFTTVYGALLLDLYVTEFLYLGAPFYVLLLLYMLLKSRERRRQEALQRVPRPVSPGGPAGETGPGSKLPEGPPGPGQLAGAPGPAAGENACPSCQAVVYPGEKSCWKCGTSLPAAAPQSGGGTG